MISIIVAIDKNGAIGRKNQLLWHLPADLKYFKEKTFGHSVIMGDRTFESIGRPLPNRKNIVVSLIKDYKVPDGVELYGDLKRLLQDLKRAESENGDNQEYFIIGGASVYRFCFDYADKLYITQIEAIAEEPDAFFPKIDPNVWDLCSVSEPQYDKENDLTFRFLQYIRK